MNCSALYFPCNVVFRGTIEILDINAVDPAQEETAPTEDAADNQLAAFSRKSLKWLSKLKDDAASKLDQVKREYDSKQNEKLGKNDIADEEDESKSMAVARHFSDDIHLQQQSNIPSFLAAFVI